MVATNVDIPALKARHPLGEVVEASGVRLRGKGRVRQGVCPFHDEAEASFTVYGDTERFWCFGCGEGGDMLDFVQRIEGLSPPPRRSNVWTWAAIGRFQGPPLVQPKRGVRIPPRCPRATPRC